MDQLVADGPGASLQTSNTIHLLLLLLVLLPLPRPLYPCPPSSPHSPHLCPAHECDGWSVTCVSVGADVSPTVFAAAALPATVQGSLRPTPALPMDHQWAVFPRKWAQDVVHVQAGALKPVWGGFLGPRVSLQSEPRLGGTGWLRLKSAQAYGAGTHGAGGGGHLGHQHLAIIDISTRPILRIDCSMMMGTGHVYSQQGHIEERRN